MKISLKELQAAARESDLTEQQITKLWHNLIEQHETKPSFKGSHVAYYFGGLLIILAMTIFITEKWDALGHAGALTVFIIYAIAFFFSGKTLWQKAETKIPGGILLTIPICLTPLIAYKLMLLLNVWPDTKRVKYQDFYILIREYWLILEVATIVIGLIFVKYFRFPFMTLPIAFCFWFMSMDLTSFLYEEKFLWEQRANVSMYFGLLMLCGTYLIDRRTKEDFAFWGYLFGTLAFWGGMTMLPSSTELNKFFYACINLAMIVASVMLQRKILIVCGSLGFLGYLFHLTRSIFKDNVTFSIGLTVIGILCIYLVTRYQKYKKEIDAHIVNAIPKCIRDDLPMNR